MDTPIIVIDPATQATIIQTISAKLQAHYIFPEVAAELSARLQQHLAAGDYAPLTDSAQFAQTLTEQLQAVNQDKHLRVRWYPLPLPEEAGPLQTNENWLEEWQQQSALDNHGLYKVERLPGNVGYLDIRVFAPPAWGGDTAAAAMNFLAHTHALLVDLRKCRGGSPDMITLIGSYLFGGNGRIQLNSLYWRENNVTKQFWVMPYVPGKHYEDKPVYVLTSQDTFSAGEGFAYDLQANKRATLIGEATRGGAHPGMPFRLHPHLDVFIPNGRAINPITNSNWEGTGVIPDLASPAAQAFNIGYRLALTAILASISATPTPPLAQLKEEAQTALNNLADAAPQGAG